jgi:hypothetical protein
MGIEAAAGRDHSDEQRRSTGGTNGTGGAEVRTLGCCGPGRPAVRFMVRSGDRLPDSDSAACLFC